jgi:hypothetical protein
MPRRIVIVKDKRNFLRAGIRALDQTVESNGRHVSQIEKHCEPGDPMCLPRQRQALLHGVYDSRKI